MKSLAQGWFSRSGTEPAHYYPAGVARPLCGSVRERSGSWQIIEPEPKHCCARCRYRWQKRKKQAKQAVLFDNKIPETTL